METGIVTTIKGQEHFKVETSTKNKYKQSLLQAILQL